VIFGAEQKTKSFRVLTTSLQKQKQCGLLSAWNQKTNYL